MEVRVAVFQVRRRSSDDAQELCVLLWQQARAFTALHSPTNPHPVTEIVWSLPGGWLRDDEDITQSITRQLAEKVDVHTLSHLEQLKVFSHPERRRDGRVIAATFLGIVPTTACPQLPSDTAWIPVAQLPRTTADHAEITAAAEHRLVSKLGYTNLGFALSPEEFTISELRAIYEAALHYRVDATNLQRTLQRRHVIEPTGETTTPGAEGGRPARLFRFVHNHCEITDASAILRPPSAKDTELPC